MAINCLRGAGYYRYGGQMRWVCVCVLDYVWKILYALGAKQSVPALSCAEQCVTLYGRLC